MFGAFGTLPGIKRLMELSEAHPWVHDITVYVDGVFNDAAHQDDTFISFLQNKASRATRDEISSQLCAQILLIANHPTPLLIAREWIMRLVEEYAPLRVLMTEGPYEGEYCQYPGLRGLAEKTITTCYNHYLDDERGMNSIFQELHTREQRIHFDLLVAARVLSKLDSDNQGEPQNPQVLIEHACCFHASRMCEQMGIEDKNDQAGSQARYREIQNHFLEGQRTLF